MMWNINLSKMELLIFSNISSEINDLGSLSRAADLSVNRVSEILKKLEEKGFVLDMARRPRRVGIRDLEHSMALRALFLEMAHIDWSKYLDNSSISVLINIADEFVRADQIAYETSLKTVYNVLKKFRSIGGVRKHGGAYKISSRFHMLKFFLDSYSSYYYRRLITEIDTDAWIIWNGPDKILFGANKVIADERVEMTGIQAVPDRFPDLVCDHYLYVVPKKKDLTVEEHIAYTLRGLSNEGRVIRAVNKLLKNNTKDLDIACMKHLLERTCTGHLLENGGKSDEW